MNTTQQTTQTSPSISTCHTRTRTRTTRGSAPHGPCHPLSITPAPGSRGTGRGTPSGGAAARGSGAAPPPGWIMAGGGGAAATGGGGGRAGRCCATARGGSGSCEGEMPRGGHSGTRSHMRPTARTTPRRAAEVTAMRAKGAKRGAAQVALCPSKTTTRQQTHGRTVFTPTCRFVEI